jgi:hypothetical protein
VVVISTVVGAVIMVVIPAAMMFLMLSASFPLFPALVL